MSFSIKTVPTTPFEGQKPGTSGIRKKTSVFMQPHYTENFVQSVFDAKAYGDLQEGATLVIGGDGRYYIPECVQKIIKIAAAAGVSKFIIGQHGIISTPTVSHLIRHCKTQGAFVLTASHNPGGPTNDFGLKVNINNGGPALEETTQRIYENTLTIKEYRMAEIPDIDITKVGAHTVMGLDFEIRDTVEDYADMMRTLYDFDALRGLLTKPDFHIRIDCLNGVTGPYAVRIFEELLGAPKGSVVHNVPLPDFGGGHPDPNLTYAKDLVDNMDTGKYDFGAAFDGDGDRNMILGRDCFVNPCDSLAILAANTDYLPALKGKMTGVARSMPTSLATTRVAEKLGMKVFETPTGWKFFGNLMDAGLIQMCGEESFGTGNSYIREKDGIWAALGWLSVVAGTGMSLKEIQYDHWSKYGRNYFSRYDYEQVDKAAGDKVYSTLKQKIVEGQLNGKELAPGYTVAKAADFVYTDPIDGSVARNEGLLVMFEDGSRIVVRLSGTGSVGATVRIYMEQYESDPEKYVAPAEEALAHLVKVAVELTQIEAITGRTGPTVIT